MQPGEAAGEPGTGGITSDDALREGELVIVGRIPTAVSYTHLTLPTIYSV